MLLITEEHFGESRENLNISSRTQLTRSILSYG